MRNARSRCVLSLFPTCEIDRNEECRLNKKSMQQKRATRLPRPQYKQVSVLKKKMMSSEMLLLSTDSHQGDSTMPIHYSSPTRLRQMQRALSTRSPRARNRNNGGVGTVRGEGGAKKFTVNGRGRCPLLSASSHTHSALGARRKVDTQQPAVVAALGVVAHTLPARARNDEYYRAALQLVRCKQHFSPHKIIQ